jgi:hypothetical protein
VHGHKAPPPFPGWVWDKASGGWYDPAAGSYALAQPWEKISRHQTRLLRHEAAFAATGEYQLIQFDQPLRCERFQCWLDATRAIVVTVEEHGKHDYRFRPMCKGHMAAWLSAQGKETDIHVA